MLGNVVTSTKPKGVVERISMILECFRTTRGRLGLTYISNRTGIPSSTAHRLLNELSEFGLLQKIGNEYQISLRFFEIAMGATVQAYLYRVAAPILQDLLFATGENVHLAVLAEPDIVFVLKLIGSRSRRISSRPGGRLPAWATASGRVMLAFSNEEVIDRCLSTTRRKYVEGTIVARDLLEREIESAANRGYALSVNELRPDAMALAVPVFDSVGEVVAGLSVVGNTASIDTKSLIPALLTAARTLNRSLSTAEQEMFG